MRIYVASCVYIKRDISVIQCFLVRGVIMLTVALTFLFMLLIVVAMSIGVIMGRKAISGSCGGISTLGMKVVCDICAGDKNKCEKEIKKLTAKSCTKRNVL